MKSILILLVCLFLSICVYSQKKKQRYTIISENLYGRLVDGKGIQFISDSLYQFPENYDFKVIRQNDDSLIVRFLKWPKGTKKGNKLNQKFYWSVPLEKTWPEYRNRLVVMKNDSVPPHFKISKSDFENMSEERINTKKLELVIGIATLPLKIRPGKNFTFEGNISLGPTIGVRKGLTHYSPNYVSLVGNISVSTTNLNKENTDGKIDETIENIGTLSPALGLVFDLNKIQIGLFYGWDFLSRANQDKYGWLYNKKPWISLGFGYSIFHTEPKNQTQ